MNKELASILKGKLENLPFLDTVAGMVQTVEYADPTYGMTEETVRAPRKRMPVAYDTNIENCGTERENALVPNSARKGILYFEDGGINQIQYGAKGVSYRSTLVLVCWLNKELLVADRYQEITAPCMTAVIRSIVTQNPINEGVFSRLQINVVQSYPQNKAIFSNYTYDEAVMQYLRPPFEFFALQLVCTYTIPFSCIDDLTQILTPPCQNPCADLVCPEGQKIALLNVIKETTIDKPAANKLTFLIEDEYINNQTGAQPALTYALTISGIGGSTPIVPGVLLEYDTANLASGHYVGAITSNYGAIVPFEFTKGGITPDITHYSDKIRLDLTYDIVCSLYPDYLLNFSSFHESIGGYLFTDSDIKVNAVDVAHENLGLGEDAIYVEYVGNMPIASVMMNGFDITGTFSSNSGSTFDFVVKLKTMCQ